MGLVNFGALWPPKGGGTSIYTGNIDMPRGGENEAANREAFLGVLDRLSRGEQVRLVVVRNEYAKGPTHPTARIMADDGMEDARTNQRPARAPQGYGGGTRQAPSGYPPQNRGTSGYGQPAYGGYANEPQPPYDPPMDW